MVAVEFQTIWSWAGLDIDPKKPSFRDAQELIKARQIIKCGKLNEDNEVIRFSALCSKTPDSKDECYIVNGTSSFRNKNCSHRKRYNEPDANKYSFVLLFSSKTLTGTGHHERLTISRSCPLNIYLMVPDPRKSTIDDSSITTYEYEYMNENVPARDSKHHHHYRHRYYDRCNLAKVIFNVSGAIRHVAQVDIRDKMGNTPLHSALYRRPMFATVEMLLRNGTNANLTNDEGSTPLHIICNKKSKAFHDSGLAKLFFKVTDEINQLVQVDVQDNKGITPLQYAVASLIPRTVDLLLDHGASLSSFTFPDESFFVLERYTSYDMEYALHSKLVSRAMLVVEHLEKRGYELDRSEALIIMKLFAQHESFRLDQSWRNDEDFVRKAKEMMIKPSLSLYDLLLLRPKEATRKLTFKDDEDCPSAKRRSESIDRICAELGAPALYGATALSRTILSSCIEERVSRSEWQVYGRREQRHSTLFIYKRIAIFGTRENNLTLLFEISKRYDNSDSSSFRNKNCSHRKRYNERSHETSSPQGKLDSKIVGFSHNIDVKFSELLTFDLGLSHFNGCIGNGRPHVSYEATYVLAGIPPLALLADERARLYGRRREDAKDEERLATLSKWQEAWDRSKKARWTHRLIPNIRVWIERRHGELNYHLTQLLTGQGFFKHHSQRYDHNQSAQCPVCPSSIENAEHVFYHCPSPTLDLHYPKENLSTPLTSAIERADPLILAMLIDKIPVDLDDTLTQPCGKTALMHAAYCADNPEVLQVLIRKGADPIYLSSYEIFEQLIKMGADVDAIDRHGLSVLHIAILKRSRDCVIALARLCRRTKTTLDLARELLRDLLPVEANFRSNDK
ncbi:unnamed protein product [Trichogramma brassicae]|uniref:Reverse transcriptase zinc-binding domain-containing protein n=1 Tax=Trichogramma brassicae TaxID=86971 RepID=A0A6H5IFR8_9HYME|nr:unnamed protein product [Trichogramma brassicae]